MLCLTFYIPNTATKFLTKHNLIDNREHLSLALFDAKIAVQVISPPIQDYSFCYLLSR
jgi:hypothetical protein